MGKRETTDEAGHRWRVLNLLAQTGLELNEKQIRQFLDPKTISGQSVRSRSKELVDMLLATSVDHQGRTAKTFKATEMGLAVINRPVDDSVFLMDKLNADYAVLADERAAGLAPHKKFWQQHIERGMWRSVRGS